MFFNEDYLRVSKPVTTDGVNLKLNPDGTRVMKVTHAPKSARKHLEVRNQSLPNNLKMVIEDVKFIPYEPKPVVQVSEEIAKANARIAELEAELSKKVVAEMNAKTAKTAAAPKTVTNETA